jgi:aromatic ring-opening dioxygenase LigB subunit
MTLVYACIAPHGGEIVPQLAGDKQTLFSPTRKGMRKIASQMKAAKPDTIVLASPHSLRLHRHVGVVLSEHSTGKVVEGRREVSLKADCDVKLAWRILGEAERAGLPVVGANYGTFEGPLSDLAMDWGTLIPMWFFLKEMKLRSKLVIVTPSREVPLRRNFEFGRIIARTAESEKKRVAFVASADQAHAHKKNGPYGFSPKAAVYDRFVKDAIDGGSLKSILSLPQDLVDAAKPDSLWQMAVLAGVLAEVEMRGELFSYQVPTYYGMLCAGYIRV